MRFESDSIYHIYNRGNNKELVFLTEENYRFFTAKMERYFRRDGIVSIAYCLMPNHFHLVAAQSSKGQLSKTFQRLMTSFVKAINIQHQRVGHLFQGKLQARVVESEDYFMNLVRYIHLNPVVAKMVAHPSEWKHSDYRRWISDEAIPFREEFFEDGKAYEEFVLESLDNPEQNRFKEFET